MKRAIILAEYLQDARELQRYLRDRVGDEIELIVIEFDPHRFRHSVRHRALFQGQRLLRIGLGRVLLGMLGHSNAVCVSSGPGNLYRRIARRVVFINHGWGPKGSPPISDRSDPSTMRQCRCLLRNTDVVVCLSKREQTHWLVCPELADVSRPLFLPLGMPRNDYLIVNRDNQNIRNRLRRDLRIAPDAKTVLLAPTHRDRQSLDEGLLSRLLGELHAIDASLGEHGMTLLFRPHYFNTIAAGRLASLRNVRYAGYDRFRDPRDLMILSDVLVTDYSSIFVDYLLLGKPVVFRIDDLDEVKRKRGLVVDYDDPVHVPGPVIESLHELLSVRIDRRVDYTESLRFYYAYPDQHATQRVGDLILEEVARLR